MSAFSWIGAAAIVLVALLAYAITTYNALVRLRNLAREGWSGIAVQLRRRTDLVPNLVDTVKAYAAHEKGVFDEIAARRATSIGATGVTQQAHAEQALNQSLGRLIALAEAYPDLKADANFRSLQDSLADIEDQLQMARRYYNGTARELNIRVESFPANLIARAFGFRQETYFELDTPTQAATPHVAF